MLFYGYVYLAPTCRLQPLDPAVTSMANVKKGYPILAKVKKYFEAHPVQLLVGSFSVATGVFGAVYSGIVRPMRFNRAIDKTLQRGSKPEQLPTTFVIERPKEIESVTRLLNTPVHTPRFGVVLGPSGTGKSFVTRAACYANPSWILYHELFGADTAANELATVAGFREGKGFFDSIFGFIVPKIEKRPYYELPEEPCQALDRVLSIVGDRSKYLIKKKKLDRMPCFVIDGVDLLAKYNPRAFQGLVKSSKLLANQGELQVILVSSEGHVMPFIESSSEANRSNGVVEILDITDDAAKDFLMNGGMPESLAICTAKLVGNRIVYLRSAAYEYAELISNSDITEDITEDQEDLFLAMFKEKHLAKYISRALAEVVRQRPVGAFVVRTILEKGPLDREDLMELWDKEDQNIAIDPVIIALVVSNLLRYQANSTLAFHSEIIRRRVIEKYN